MRNLFQAAQNVQAFCDSKGWRSCFIGGIAVLRWGEPRVTRDIDLTLITGFGTEAVFVDQLLQGFRPRIAGAKEFALANRTLLLQTEDGVPIDLSLGALPFETLVVDRATGYAFEPKFELRTCSAEDLLVLKLFASRPIDVHDAEGVVIRNKSDLDWQYIEEQLAPLIEVKGNPEIARTLERLRRM